MPIFEFKCNNCGKVFEELVISSKKDEVGICPKCGSQDTSRLLSSFSSSVQGSGGGLGVLSSSCSSSSGGFS
ncbi:MAG: zinc ribbon domain-containing protein [Deltaproteobacteria bacterium]|nr:zinc ribbon domain-containing protein [Deltaproteobacteria bacterium]MBW2015371.1 zinc ribbon domain-containing protein [Deltaproteobacteria bacterium]MBW2127999.1 zinc ribbon domain-containing protein [Deltaproteobacteria bacterium]MBW2302578.1 zinc ribbon domain-containing protein [Deltaproteobacteria bacterium]